MAGSNKPGNIMDGSSQRKMFSCQPVSRRWQEVLPANPSAGGQQEVSRFFLLTRQQEGTTESIPLMLPCIPKAVFRP